MVLRRELVILFLVSCLIFASVPTALCRSPMPVIYVAGDGSGDFSCDGIDDHVQINQALKFVAENPGYTTVYLKGPFTYVIDDTLLIGSNTILEGDSTAVIKLTNHAGWPTMKPLLQQMSSLGNNNIVIRGFEVNVNYEGNSEITLGKGYYHIMYFLRCNNVKVYDMYMHDGPGDGLRINQGKNVQFYNNKVYKLGHDSMFAIGCEDVEAWNNCITCRTNSALRMWNSNKVKLHDNLIDSFYHWSAGGPGIQIEKSSGVMDNIEIYNNTIHNTYGPGIWIYNYDNSSATRSQGKNIYIHHNIFYSTGTNPSINWVGGIVASEFYDTLIENNVFDGVYHAAVVHMFSPPYSPKGGYKTIVRNNVIVNTQKRTKDPSGTGYAVINYLPETHTFVLENNCLYNNSAGNYKNCASTTGIYVNPLFADQKNHDYHLHSTAGRWDGKTWVKDKVSSPCIDAGYRYSDYSYEPAPSGNRINIGPDGNTRYASKSEYVPTQILPTANFSSNVSTGYALLSIQFTDHSKNTTSRVWNFGDGSNSTRQNPTHTYSVAGNYTVNLTASNGNGTESKTAKITVLEKSKSVLPVANFSTNVSSGTAPLSVHFTDLSQNSTARIWNFGDGSNSTQQNPTHTYSAGNYTVNLTASNGNGTDSKTVTINGLKATPIITWSNPTDIIYGKALDSTQLNASSSVPGTFVYTPSSGTVLSVGTQILHVDFTPADVANYTTASKSGTINVSEKPVLPVANFSTNVTIGIAPFSVQFTDLSQNATSRIWNFGDSTNSTQKSPMHRYSTAGNYTVTLTVSNVNGTDSKTATINVLEIEKISIISGNIYDNRLREASPEGIYSDKEFLDLGATRGSGRYRDVILFNLSGYTNATQINNATLSLFWYYPTSSRLKDTVIEVYRPASAWNSNYVSWNKKDKNTAWNNPGGDWYDKNGVLQGNTPYATLTMKASSLPNNSYYELNITDLVREYSSGTYANTGFLIKARNESENYIAFYSADFINKRQVPELKVAYS